MFVPKLSSTQRRLVSDLRTRLAAALEPVVIADNPKLPPLTAKRTELTGEISGIERGADVGNLEASAQLLANRRTQIHLVDQQIKEMQESRGRAETQAQKESAKTLDVLSAEARGLLAEISTSFQIQHKEALLEAVGQYANRHSAEAANMVRLIPYFTFYLKRIRAFEGDYTTPAQLLEWLESALKNEDFLAPTTSTKQHV